MEKKLRHSRQREQIYEYLRATCAHPSAEEIYQALKPALPELSLATVYRNLKLLEQLGQVRRVASVDGAEHYDACCGDHAHFVCQRCGCVRDIPGDDAAKIRSALSLEEGYEICRLDMTVSGVCPDCAR